MLSSIGECSTTDMILLLSSVAGLSNGLGGSATVVASSSPSLRTHLFVSSLSERVRPFPSLGGVSGTSEVMSFPVSLQPAGIIELRGEAMISLL